MTTCYIVVEGETDATILASIFADQVRNGEVDIKIGQGRSSAVSLARTMLVSRREAMTALVLDAGSTDQDRVRDMALELQDSLADVSRRERFGVFLLSPAIEACLFQDPDGLADVLGSSFSSEEIVQSRYDPKATIQSKLDQRGATYGSAILQAILDRVDIQQLRNTAGLQPLLRFVAKSTEAAPA